MRHRAWKFDALRNMLEAVGESLDEHLESDLAGPYVDLARVRRARLRRLLAPPEGAPPTEEAPDVART